MFNQISRYFNNNFDEYTLALKQHLLLVLITLSISIIISISIGIICSYKQNLKNMFTACFGILRVIPSLALLICIIPLVGVGTLPASIALVVLAIPPIFIGTTTGFATLPSDVLENAKAMGMNEIQIFTKVSLPLALPLILKGIQTSAVEITANATLAAYIGAGGLGSIIFTGLGLYRMDLLLIGGISVAILSILVDSIMSSLVNYIKRYEM